MTLKQNLRYLAVFENEKSRDLLRVSTKFVHRFRGRRN